MVIKEIFEWWQSREDRWALFECTNPKCLLHNKLLKYKITLINGVIAEFEQETVFCRPTCLYCKNKKFMSWLFPWSNIQKFMNNFKFLKRRKTPKMNTKKNDLFQKFIDEELDGWIKPDEFSFGPSGANNTLQPCGSKDRIHAKEDISEETQIKRYNLALKRKNAGLPRAFWMPWNKDKIPESAKHLT